MASGKRARQPPSASGCSRLGTSPPPSGRGRARLPRALRRDGPRRAGSASHSGRRPGGPKDWTGHTARDGVDSGGVEPAEEHEDSTAPQRSPSRCRLRTWRADPRTARSHLATSQIERRLDRAACRYAGLHGGGRRRHARRRLVEVRTPLLEEPEATGRRQQGHLDVVMTSPDQRNGRIAPVGELHDAPLPNTRLRPPRIATAASASPASHEVTVGLAEVREVVLDEIGPATEVGPSAPRPTARATSTNHRAWRRSDWRRLRHR